MYAIPFLKTSLQHPSKNDSLASMHIAESYWYVKNYDSSLAYYRSYERNMAATMFQGNASLNYLPTRKIIRKQQAIYKKLAAEGLQ
jgi:hypothetical protein